MTADELQRIVLRLANQTGVRYWLHWNYPHQGPWLMAIAVWMPRNWDVGGYEAQYEAQKDMVSELLKLGFVLDHESSFYIIERTDEDGTPYTSPM